mmetsp:Transcript_30953/g.50071  ORF Transcript_30953/g.50071 Transcript_30953/m.50071 type:complete len:296 (-) Transcript_30953:3-890(-)
MGIELFREAILGGLSSMSAATCTHPIDLLKVRFQLSSRTTEGGALTIVTDIIKKEGVSGLYKGLTASLLRQATYSTTRFGAYAGITDVIGKLHHKDGHQSHEDKLFGGLLAGAMGAVAGNPADMVMVRMQGDGRLAPEKRRNYKNVVDGIRRVVQEEGVLALWKGSTPTVFRAMLMTAAQKGEYEHAKEFLLSRDFEDSWMVHFSASLYAGFIATTVTSPVDVVKTRFQNAARSGSASPMYSGPLDCFLKTVKQEGPLALYKGFIPNFLRLGPQTMITMLVWEELEKLVHYMQHS